MQTMNQGRLTGVRFFWLLGVPAALWLVFAAWTELGLPFPIEGKFTDNGESLPWPGIPLVTYFDGYPDDRFFPLSGSFRHLFWGPALVAASVGFAVGFWTTKRWTYVAAAIGFVLLAYVAVLAWEGWLADGSCRISECYHPASYLEKVGVHTDEHSPTQAFWMTVEVLGTGAIIVASSIWAGLSISELYRSLTGRTEEL